MSLDNKNENDSVSIYESLAETSDREDLSLKEIRDSILKSKDYLGKIEEKWSLCSVDDGDEFFLSEKEKTISEWIKYIPCLYIVDIAKIFNGVHKGKKMLTINTNLTQWAWKTRQCDKKGKWNSNQRPNLDVQF